MSRRFSYAVLLLVVQLTGAALPGIASAAETKPNLLFILTDDQRLQTLGCYGNTIVKTPNLDRLAAEGVLMENATVTSAICTPSRACYFLGQYERKHGVNFNSGTSLNPAAWANSYPLLLRQAGYFTGYVGKNHVPVGADGYNSGIVEKSFDFWYGAHGHLSFYPKTAHAIFRNAKADTQVEILQEAVERFIDPEGTFIEGAVATAKSRPKEKPFCLSVCFNVPHGAGTRSMKQLPTDPPLYRTSYRELMPTLPLAGTYVAKADIKTPKLPPDVLYAQYRQNSYDYVDTEATMREQTVREYQTITGIDQFVGAVRQSLAKAGLAENTVIIYSSDHGILSGEFGLGGKALNYDPCLRVPMILMDPRVETAQRGRRATELVQSVDVAPTLLELAGVQIPPGVQGKSMVPLLRGQKSEWRQYAFAENLWSTTFGNPRCESVRGTRWKYIRYFANDRSLFEANGGNKVTPEHAKAYADWLSASTRGEKPVYEELYDLQSDPQERNNLAGDPAHREQLKVLQAECQRQVTAARGNLEEPPPTLSWLGGAGEGGEGSARGKKKGR